MTNTISVLGYGKRMGAAVYGYARSIVDIIPQRVPRKHKWMHRTAAKVVRVIPVHITYQVARTCIFVPAVTHRIPTHVVIPASTHVIAPMHTAPHTVISDIIQVQHPPCDIVPATVHATPPAPYTIPRRDIQVQTTQPRATPIQGPPKIDRRKRLRAAAAYLLLSGDDSGDTS